MDTKWFMQLQKRNRIVFILASYVMHKNLYSQSNKGANDPSSKNDEQSINVVVIKYNKRALVPVGYLNIVPRVAFGGIRNVVSNVAAVVCKFQSHF